VSEVRGGAGNGANDDDDSHCERMSVGLGA
jgi:hypothetical protein